MPTNTAQQVRCPCCGETFSLTPDMLVTEPPQPTSDTAAKVPMQPISDTAAKVPIRIVFDGGSIGNPGKGYGSYQLTVRGKAEPPKRLDFGDGYTNNEAEYDTLIGALEAVIRRAKDPGRIQLDIRGDSQLVIKQIKGEWKIKEPRMLQRVQQVRALLDQLGSWTATWHDRSNSVDALGH